MSDGDLRALVVRARSGDAAAFTQIVLQLQDAIVGYAWGVLRDRQRGEDAAQEAFLEAFLRLGELRDPGAFAPWLRSITFSKCNRMLRRADPITAVDAAEATTGDPVEAHLEMESQVRGLVERDGALLAARQGAGFVDFTPLHVAARKDLPDMVDLLTELGAPLSPPDKLGRTAIDVALLAGNRRAYERLAAHGAEPSRATVAIAESIERAEQLRQFFDALWNDVGTVERMLARDPSLLGAKLPNFWEDNYVGGTALHLAAGMGKKAVAELLLSRGASLESRDDRYGGTPIDWAKEFDRPEMVALLTGALGGSPG